MATNFPENPNPNDFTSFDYQHGQVLDPSFMGFDFPDYPILDFGAEAETTTFSEMGTGGGSGSTGATSTTINTVQARNGREGRGGGNKVAFRTKSDSEILDDGFKWRKYGKKYVKDSPNPRNYYKCSTGGCGVKKRVERDRDDPGYVITTYEGVHNHESPFMVYCNDPIFPNATWTATLQSSSPLHSSSSF